MAKPRRTFTPAFQAQAVQRVTEPGRRIAAGARDLDPGESSPRGGKTALAAAGAPAFPGRGHPPAPEEERRRPRAENERPVMGRDVLKEATAFFARESS